VVTRDGVAQVDDARHEHLVPCESEQPANERRGPCCCVRDLLDIGDRRRAGQVFL